MTSFRAYPLWVLLIFAGCSGDSSSQDQMTSNSEWFVFVADGIDEDMRSEAAQGFQHLLGEEAIAGDVIHFIASPDQQPVASLIVPSGGRNSRLRHSEIRPKLAKIKPLFDGSRATGNLQLGLPAVPSVVNSLRNTTFSPRIILVGNPLYDDPQQQGWSMVGGYVPQDGALEAAECPFHASANFPEGSTISWLTPSGQWGAGERHRSEVKRFYQLFAQAKNQAAVVRFTAKGETAFSAGTFRPDSRVIAQNDGRQMRFVGQTTERREDVNVRKPVVVDVDASSPAPSPVTPSSRPNHQSSQEVEQLLQDAESDPTMIAIAINSASQDAHCDIDMYVSVAGKPEELCFRQKDTSFGHLFRDVTRSGSINKEADDYQNWEWAKLDHVEDIGDVTVWLNAFQSSKPATVRVICVWKGVRRQKTFTVDGPGNGGQNKDHRGGSSAWQQVTWDQSWERI